MLELWGMQSTSSLPSLLGSPDSPIYVSNRIVWHLNWVQTNDLWLIELFGKQMTDIELFVIHSNTWNHLILLTYIYKSYMYMIIIMNGGIDILS